MIFSVRNVNASKKSYKSQVVYGQDNNNAQISVDRRYTEKMYVSLIPSDKTDTGISEKLSKIITHKGEGSILSALQLFDRNIEDFQLTSEGIFFGYKGVKERIPSNILGDGIRRFLDIITAVSEQSNAFICIDEIENGLHYSVYDLLWRSLLSFSEQNEVQLFITTHNIETLQRLKSVLEEERFQSMQDYSKVFSVVKSKKEGTQSYKYSFEGFKDAIEHDLEIRN